MQNTFNVGDVVKSHGGLTGTVVTSEPNQFKIEVRYHGDGILYWWGVPNCTLIKAKG